MAWDKYITATVTVTPTTNDAYQANDVIGGLATISIRPATVNGGILNKVRLVDNGSTGAALRLWLFNAVPSTIADDAAFAPDADDLGKCFTMITIAAGDYVTVNSLDRVEKGDLNEVFAVDGKGQFYLYVECTGTPTYTAAKTLVFHFDILTQGG